MDLSSVTNSFVTSATVMFGLNLLLKSTAVLAVFWLIDKLIGQRLSSQNRHLLWLNALFCLAVLPILSLLLSNAVASDSGVVADAWFEITVAPVSAGDAVSDSNAAASWLLLLYLVPTAWLLLRMLVSWVQLRRISQGSGRVSCPSTKRLLSELRTQLGISRNITLRSGHIDSPLSFGLLKPCIILPAQSRHWSSSVMTDVLLHELSHIKRLDWLTMLLAWFIAAFYWINPLVWFAIKRLDDEAENSCDAAVLHAGRSDTDYAESLLSVAQACIHSAQLTHGAKLPAQMMLDRNTLKARIHRILENNTMNTSDKKSVNHLRKSLALMLLVSAGTLFGIGGAHLVSAQPSSPLALETEEEMVLLHQVEPVYPVRAFQRKVEGWAQVQFTVTAAGTVDPDSIEVWDSEPRGMFNTSAMKAIAQFTFKPRIQNGVAVDVPNVQYVFRYDIGDDEE